MPRYFTHSSFCLFLSGACVDNAILSNQGFTDYAKLPSLVTAQGNVVGALSLVTSQTSTLLQRGTVHLTSLLDNYVKQQSGDTVEAKDGDSWEAGSSLIMICFPCLYIILDAQLVSVFMAVT